MKALEAITGCLIHLFWLPDKRDMSYAYVDLFV